MTRTRSGEFKDPANAPRERRQSRNGLSDVRSIPKKSGGGAGNWGVPGSEVDETDNDYSMLSSSAPEKKINVVDAKTFGELHSNVGKYGPAMSSGQQGSGNEESSSASSSSSSSVNGGEQQSSAA